ncbi:MAG TPA: hypothetical protein VMH26_13620 [Burkholderiales bacterium]|nr:hypothetical protein [Burkholderiales bacterium]
MDLPEARLARLRTALPRPLSLPTLSLTGCAALLFWQRSRPWDMQALRARLRREGGARPASRLNASCAHLGVLAQQGFAAGLVEPINALRPLVRLTLSKARAAR